MDSYACGGIRVRHSEPLLVVPAEPTPNEIKQVSDIDDQEGLRMHHFLIMFYKSNPSMKLEADPAKVIARAISRALVHYYPLAGRLREGPNRKLMVDCSGEGVLFIEAEVDIALDQLGDSIGPPCPHWKQFLHQVPGSEGIVGCPLLLIQVTHLSCGGFVFALRMNHVLCDSYGLVRFLDMVGTIARDPHTPVQLPVWQREIFSARDPPRITCMHPEYEDVKDPSTSHYSLRNSSNKDNNMAHESFFFGPKEILTLRKRLPSKYRKCSTLELLLACLWKCRTLALDLDPIEVVVLSCFITAHGKVRMPKGYYGNAFAFAAAISEAGLLCQNPLGYALELIREAKARVNEEYIRSVVDLMVLKGRPMYRTAGHFMVGDMTRVGFEHVDFGWGKPVYGGPVGAFPLISYTTRFRNSRGEDGIAVPIVLPQLVMKRFLTELVKMTTDDEEIVNNNHPNDIMEAGVLSKL